MNIHLELMSRTERALLGHSDKWQMHMKGVQRMLEMKGRIDGVSMGL